MAEHVDEQISEADQERVQPFLDCVAYLMAKRWLREQRDQEDKPPKRREPCRKQVER